MGQAASGGRVELTANVNGIGGRGGSGGEDGTVKKGGKYGGGGGGGNESGTIPGDGAQGVVRIMIGTGKTFPAPAYFSPYFVDKIQ